MSAPVVDRKQGRPRTPIEHGTEAGYQKHRRYGPPIDDADSCGCRRANREATYIRQGRTVPEPRTRVRKRPRRRLSRAEATVIDLIQRYALDETEARELLAMLGLAAA